PSTLPHPASSPMTTKTQKARIIIVLQDRQEPHGRAQVSHVSASKVAASLTPSTRADSPKPPESSRVCHRCCIDWPRRPCSGPQSDVARPSSFVAVQQDPS